jgi:hypothetical protein
VQLVIVSAPAGDTVAFVLPRFSVPPDAEADIEADPLVEPLTVIVPVNGGLASGA